eukprot:4832478-Amphidinium_carterae.1
MVTVFIVFEIPSVYDGEPLVLPSRINWQLPDTGKVGVVLSLGGVQSSELVIDVSQLVPVAGANLVRLSIWNEGMLIFSDTLKVETVEYGLAVRSKIIPVVSKQSSVPKGFVMPPRKLDVVAARSKLGFVPT